ncbi:anti-sigma factor family protein [Nonomuraea insulae]|uniref:Anti-sigma factor family protein n=1 Tax=Nonomuraea insulae TaxID=1616787 RepID=A0ABW1CD14_9ACTN
MTCEEVRISLGVHALGALEPDEALEIDHHLATCDDCGAELAELAGVTSFLGKVSERDVELVASPPRQVLDRLLNDRVKRARRGRVLMAVAASAAVVAVGGTVWTSVQSRPASESAAAGAPASAQSQEPAPRALSEDSFAQRDEPQTKARSESAAPRATLKPSEARSGSASPLATPRPSKAAQGREFTGENEAAEYYATVVALPADSGTDLGVRVNGVPVDTACGLIVVGRGGNREIAQSWVVTREDYQAEALFRSETTMSMREIDHFEVVDQKTGKLLVKVPIRK